MNSIELRGIAGRPTLNIADELTHKSGTQTRSDVTPIVFVVMDEASDRELLELLIRGKGWYSETFASVQDFLAHPSGLVPSTLILELAEDRNALEVQKRLAAERPEMPVIFVTSYGDVRTAVRAIKAGAIEFLTRPMIDDVMLTAVQQALECSRTALARKAEMSAVHTGFL